MRVWLSVILYTCIGLGNSMSKAAVDSLGVQVYEEVDLDYGTKWILSLNA